MTHSVKEPVGLMRAQPGRLNYASAGVGTTTHLAMEMLKSASGTFALHVSYKGNGPACAAVITGQVEILFGSLPTVLPRAKSGRVRPLAVGTLERTPSFPEVATVAESGYAGFDASPYLATIVPVGTPTELVPMIRDGMAKYAKIVKTAGVQAQ